MRSTFFPKLVNGPYGDPALYLRIAHSKEALLFDCGEIHRLSHREALKISSILISHAHIDHLVGFDTLLRLFLNRPHPLKVFGPPGIIERIGSRLAGYTWNLTEGYPFCIDVFEWGSERVLRATFRAENEFRCEEQKALPRDEFILKCPNYNVRAFPLDHGGLPSMAYALEESSHVAIHKDGLLRENLLGGPWLTRFKALVREGLLEERIEIPLNGAGWNVVRVGELLKKIAHVERGMKISYVTDVSPTAENFEKIEGLAANSHLLAIEATFAHRDLDRALKRGHLTARHAGEIARRAGAARILVFHHSPRYREKTNGLAEEAHVAFTSSDRHASPSTPPGGEGQDRAP